jgi:hypothetical protein
MESRLFVKARKSGMLVKVQDAGLMHHVEQGARPSAREDTHAFRSTAPTGPMEVPGFGVRIPSLAGVCDNGISISRGIRWLNHFLLSHC